MYWRRPRRGSAPPKGSPIRHFRPAARSASLLSILVGALAVAPSAEANVADFTAAHDSAFKSVPPLHSRAMWNILPRLGSDEIVVSRFFIPNNSAGGTTLDGDDRTWTDAPVETRSRGWLVWNVAGGEVALTMSPSTQRDTDLEISALRVVKKPSADDVIENGVQFGGRTSNDAWATRTSSGGLRVKTSLLNSFTNQIPAASWSVDNELRIEPRNTTGFGLSGGFDVTLNGDGYPAFESYTYRRSTPGRTTLMRRKVDPDKINSLASRLADSGGGVGALSGYANYNCTSRADGGSFCQNLLGTGRLRFGLVGYVSPESYATNPTDNPGSYDG